MVKKKDFAMKSEKESLFDLYKGDGWEITITFKDWRMLHKLEVFLDESPEWASAKKISRALDIDIDEKRLKRASKTLGIKPKKIWDMRYGKVNAYHCDVWMDAFNIDISTFQ